MNAPAASWWASLVPPLLPGTAFDVVEADEERATALFTRADGQRAVFKAARASAPKLAALETQWEVLSRLGDAPDFPGPRPIDRIAAGEVAAIVLAFLPGEHPRFGEEAEFRLFGATIARLHRVSLGRSLAGARRWDASSIASHFADPRLLALMRADEQRLARAAIDRFGPLYERLLAEARWTGIVHSDAHRHNVVLDGASGSLIDFGESGTGVVFWDLGVAAADSVVDAPEHAEASRRALIEGYLSILPEAELVLASALPACEALRSLEVMTWPVSDWPASRLEDGESREEARENIAAACEHLGELLG